MIGHDLIHFNRIIKDILASPGEFSDHYFFATSFINDAASRTLDLSLSYSGSQRTSWNAVSYSLDSILSRLIQIHQDKGLSETEFQELQLIHDHSQALFDFFSSTNPNNGNFSDEALDKAVQAADNFQQALRSK